MIHDTRVTGLHRLACLVASFLAVALLASPSALAATPPERAGANGYNSAYENLLKQQALNRAAGTNATSNSIASPASEPNECGAPGWIASAYNGLYVTAELGDGGVRYAMLRARSTSVGEWERFQLCYFPKTERFSIYSDANKLWVSNELGYVGQQYGMLRARSETVGPWERLRVYPITMGQMLIEGSNSLLVAAEFGDSGVEYGMLRARSTEGGPWERFWEGIKA